MTVEVPRSGEARRAFGADAAFMATRRLHHPASERGFTLLEMLVTIIVLMVLIAIAVPAYLKFRDRGNSAAAAANIRTTLPAIEAYRSDNGAGGYTGMTMGGAAGLIATYDASIKGWNAATSTGVTVLSKSASTYCVKSVSGGIAYYKNGPGADIVASPACT